MNPESEETHQDSREKRSGSFYEPRTIPKKWDVSAFVSRGNQATEVGEENPASPGQPEADDSEEKDTPWNPNPFPQPRTIPGKWDVSGMK